MNTLLTHGTISTEITRELAGQAQEQLQKDSRLQIAKSVFGTADLWKIQRTFKTMYTIRRNLLK
jgi:hypothetical protein